TVLRALGLQNDEADALAPSDPWKSWSLQLDAPDGLAPCAPPEPRPPLQARPVQLSVTEISTWQRNPYAIYARRILRLKKLDAIDADVTAADRGTIIHNALEKFLAAHLKTWPDDPLEALLAAGRGAFAPFADRPQVAAFWWPRFENIARWFVALETERRQQGFRPLATESEGRLLLANGTFTLHGRADRVDLQPDGAAAIIDYKTGTAPTNKDVENALEPQLPLLALIAEEGGFEKLGPLRAGSLGYWLLKGGDEGETQQSVKGDPAQLIAAARERLEFLLRAYADPAMPYRAIPRAQLKPKYDDYAHLARLAEWGRL
ncbi:MAG: double-strand break repair protein AddB, partial [Alphaproteobacteria bacterium]|nr:double-strand break repair protein AddB [Alphaproteobacteria bacterium]